MYGEKDRERRLVFRSSLSRRAHYYHSRFLSARRNNPPSINQETNHFTRIPLFAPLPLIAFDVFTKDIYIPYTLYFPVRIHLEAYSGEIYSLLENLKNVGNHRDHEDYFDYKTITLYLRQPTPRSRLLLLLRRILLPPLT